MKMFPNNNPVLVPFLSAVKTQFIFLYCYISPEIGYLFSWTSLKAKTGPLCCCVSVEVDGRGKKSNPRLPTGRALTGGTDSHRMWLPLQGRPLWWGSWRFSHRVREAHGSPVGIRHPSAGFSLRGCGVRKQMTLNVGHESADPVMAQPQWQLWLTSRLMHHVQNKLLRLVLHLHGHTTATIFLHECVLADYRSHLLHGLLLTLNLWSSKLRTCPVVMELLTLTLVTEP